MTGGEPRLSIVLPVLNGAHTLPRCLAALPAAAPPGTELLVVDDGSTDDTARLAEAAPLPVRVLRHSENRGTSAARNTGWRAARAELVAFVDADMVLRPDALTRLVEVLDAHPELRGANGTVSLDLDADLDPLDAVTDFVNASLHWQLSRHGDRVASAFTAICVFRRSALEEMDGWDEQWFSRYADDVATRFVLPPRSLAFVGDAQGAHLKTVPLRGLLKHRFNIGYFFVASLAENRGETRADNAVLDLRYPLNTVAALATGGLAGVLVCLGPLGLVLSPTLAVPASLHLAANARFSAFVARRRGVKMGLVSLPLSALEGYAYGAGLIAGTMKRLRSPRGHDA